MRWILSIVLLISLTGLGQYKDYKLNAKGDTLNRVDMQGKKQGPWVITVEPLRGEPGYEEEGYFENDRKEGEWRLFTLLGDMVGLENYKWGLKDGICRYFTTQGELRLEQSWKALNPDKLYDTIQVEDVETLDKWRTVIVKNEGAALKHGEWKYYNAETGAVVKTERYEFGKLEGDPNATASKNVNPGDKKAVAKPKEVLEFEKKNSGKKKVKYKDGTTGG